MSTTTTLEVKTAAELAQQPEEYQTAVQKIVISHAVNELYGAQVFDEPAIQLAPTPYAKWLTCRVAMEEYHHHVRFKALADEIGIPAERMDPQHKRPLSIFEFQLQDLAGVLRDQGHRRLRRDPAGRRPAALQLPSAAQPRPHHHAGGEVPRQVRQGLLPGADPGRPRARRCRMRSTATSRSRPAFFGASQLEEQRDVPQVGPEAAHQRRDAGGLPGARDRAGGEGFRLAPAGAKSRAEPQGAEAQRRKGRKGQIMVEGRQSTTLQSLPIGLQSSLRPLRPLRLCVEVRRRR